MWIKSDLRWRAALAFGVSLLALSPAAAQEALKVVLSSEARSLDPTIDTNALTLPVTNTIMETLGRTGPGLEVSPLLAEAWEPTGETTWRIKLRPGVAFHNGEPMNADALIYSIDAFLKTQGTARGYFSFIAGATKVDDLTVDIETSGPTSLLPSTLPFLYVLPPKYHAEVGSEGFGTKPVGTGPWKFANWSQGVEIGVARNEDYWGDKPGIGDITFRFAPDASSRIAQILTGEADLANDIPPSMIPRVESGGSAQVLSKPSARKVFLQINMEEGPTADVRVRRGLAHAIDVPSIVRVLYRGHAEASAQGFVVEGLEGYQEGAYPLPAYDVDKAKALFAEAGYPDGFKLDFWHPVGRYLLDKEAAQAIAGQLEKAGVTVELHGMEPAAYFSKTASEKVPGVNFFACGPLFVNPVFCPIVHYKTGAAWAYGVTDKTDGYIEQITTTLDDARRVELVREFQTYMVDEVVPAVWLWRQESIYAVNGQLDWTPSSDERIWFRDMAWK